MTPKIRRITHPEVIEPDDKAMAADRAYFAANPGEVVHLRPLIKGEFLIDVEMGSSGHRPSIRVAGFEGDGFPFVAVVDAAAAAGVEREDDGSGLRVRFPVSSHAPGDVEAIKRMAWTQTVAFIQALRRQHGERPRPPRLPRHRARGFR